MLLILAHKQIEQRTSKKNRNNKSNHKLNKTLLNREEMKRWKKSFHLATKCLTSHIIHNKGCNFLISVTFSQKKNKYRQPTLVLGKCIRHS